MIKVVLEGELMCSLYGGSKEVKLLTSLFNELYGENWQGMFTSPAPVVESASTAAAAAGGTDLSTAPASTLAYPGDADLEEDLVNAAVQMSLAEE